LKAAEEMKLIQEKKEDVNELMMPNVFEQADENVENE